MENAFEFFGGAPHSVLCDNPKTIVLDRDAYGDGRHRLNPAFLDFTGHYGVRVHLCHPYRAQTKGKVERFHRYVRQSFYVPLISRLHCDLDVATANREIRPWLHEVANVRVHRTTKKQPIARWCREREHLLSLPPRYTGRRLETSPPSPPERLMPPPYDSLQHPLARYHELALEVSR